MLSTLARARLLDRLDPTPCTCGAGDDAIRHDSCCATMVAWEEKLRQAKDELRPIRRCKLGQVVYLR